jgi:hypothetical protein
MDVRHAPRTPVTPFFSAGYGPLSMGFYFQLAWALLGPHALAGTVSIETDAAVEVQFGETTIGRATGAGTLELGELPAGPTSLRLVRAGHLPMDASLDVPISGITTMKLTGNTLTIEGQISTLQPLANPLVLLQPVAGQQFTIVIDHTDRRQFDSETVLDNLRPGTHQVEFRSSDQLVVWARGTLRLSPGDTVVLRVEEGRMVQADGAMDAWQPEPGR